MPTEAQGWAEALRIFGYNLTTRDSPAYTSSSLCRGWGRGWVGGGGELVLTPTPESSCLASIDRKPSFLRPSLPIPILLQPLKETPVAVFQLPFEASS